MRRWYVYRVNVDGQLAYIGKGTGSRFLISARRLGGIAGILEHFKSERQALREEIRLIALHRPRFNKTKGGEGYTGKRERDLWPQWRAQFYESADKSEWWLHQLLAACAARCELNSRGIKCPEEAHVKALADPAVAEAVRRLSGWLQSKPAALLHSITYSA